MYNVYWQALTITVHSIVERNTALHLSLLPLVSAGLEKCSRRSPVQCAGSSWRIRLYLHQPHCGEGGAGGRIKAYKRCAAFHVRSEAGGEGRRPCGENHQHPNQPVNWQRSATSFLGEPSLSSTYSLIVLFTQVSICWYKRGGINALTATSHQGGDWKSFWLYGGLGVVVVIPVRSWKLYYICPKWIAEKVEDVATIQMFGTKLSSSL